MSSNPLPSKSAATPSPLSVESLTDRHLLAAPPHRSSVGTGVFGRAVFNWGQA